MENDSKKLIEEMHKAFGEFRAESAKGRDADQAKLARIEAVIAEKDALNQALVTKAEKSAADAKAATDAIEKLEAKFNRGTVAAGATAEDRAAERKGSFLTYARYGLPTDPTVEQKWANARVASERKLEAKAMIVADDTSGGFLAPPEYVREIIKAIVLVSPMREIVKVRTTGQRSVQQPKRTQTAAAQWVGETTTRTETQNMAYGLTEIPTHEMTAEVYVSFADLEDSAFDLEAELNGEFSEQFAVTEGSAVVAGNGVSKPFGILDPSAGIPTTNSGTSGSIASATGGKADKIVDLFHSVKTGYAQNGRWLLARQTLGSLRKLTDSQGRYLWEPSPAAGLPSTILGSPYTEVPDMPLEGANSLSLAFGDWRRAYTMVERLSISVVRDPYTRAGFGQVKFVARRRMGGQVMLAEAARILKCA